MEARRSCSPPPAPERLGMKAFNTSFAVSSEERTELTDITKLVRDELQQFLGREPVEALTRAGRRIVHRHALRTRRLRALRA